MQAPRRLVSRIRTECPLWPILVGLLFGQLLGFARIVDDIGALFLLTVLAMCAFSCFGWKSAVSVYIGMFLCLGLVQSALVLRMERPALSSDKSYLVQTVGEVRRPKPGGVVLTVKVIGEYTAQDGAFSYLPIASTPTIRCKAIDLPWRNIANVAYGSQFVMKATFLPAKPIRSVISYDAMLWREGISGECKIRYATAPNQAQHSPLRASRDYILSKVSRVLGNGERAGLFLSTSLGFRDLISRQTEEAFKIIGLSHLLVFSGYQVLIFYGSLVFTLHLVVRLSYRFLPGGWIRLSEQVSLKKLFAVWGVLLSAALVAIIGFEASSARAIAAAMFMMMGLVFERNASTWGGIGISLLVVSCVWPCAILDPGVQLTFAALVGIALANFQKQNALMTYMRVVIFVWITTSPVVLAWFGNISLLSVVANLTLAPVFTFLSCNVGLCGLLIYILGVDPQAQLLQVSAFCLEMMRNVAVSLANLPSIYYQTSGLPRLCLITCFMAAIARIVTERLRLYMVGENLGRKDSSKSV